MENSLAMGDQNRDITGESSRTEDDGPHIDAICNVVLSEILGRLPTRNVFQLRCVCKRWRALLGDPIFPGIHTSLFETHPSWALLLRSRLIMDSAPPSEHDPFLLMRHPRIPLECMPLSPVAGCDELLLCASFEMTRYYVVNSITKEFVLIPSPPQNLTTYGRGLVVSFDEAGLIRRSFHVVLLCEDNYSPHGFRRIVFLTFCSSDGNHGIWSYRSFAYRSNWPVIDYSLPPPTPYKGVLYWIVWPNLTIMAYDTFKNPPEFYGIPLPGSWGQVRYPNNCLCGVMEGRFCFFDQSRLWILENCREGVWREDLSIPPAECRIVNDYRLLGVHSMCVPVAFNPFAKGVVCWCDNSLAYESLETGQMRFLCSFQDAPFAYNNEIPLAAPFWPSRIPRFAEFVHGRAEE